MSRPDRRLSCLSGPVRSAAVIVSVLVLPLTFASSASAAPGGLDTSFSTDGKVTTDFSPRADGGFAVAIQPDGKIVVAGGTHLDTNNPKFAVARYHPSGSIDHSFGSDGKVITDFTSRYDAAFGVVIQPNGRIVVAGDAGIGTSNSRFAVARYRINGTLDPTFGGDGKVTTQFTPRDDPVAGIALQDDGRILVSGGAAANGANPKFALARYATNGTLDPTFGSDGRVTADFTAGLDYANDVVVQADGKIVAGGLANPSGFRASFALARFHPGGVPDNTFSGDGKLKTDFTPRGDGVQRLAVQPDGKIVAAGTAGGGTSNSTFALARYDADGTPDTGFSSDGKVTTNFTPRDDKGWDVALQEDGRIVVAGEAGVGAANSTIALARYNVGGSLNTIFSQDGKVTTNVTPREDFALGVAIQETDGKIVVAGGAGWGGSNPNFVLARYLAA